MVLAITWISTTWCCVQVQSPGRSVQLADGRVTLGPGSSGEPGLGVSPRPASSTMQWGFGWTGEGSSRVVAVPLWALLAVSSVIAVGFRRRPPRAEYR